MPPPRASEVSASARAREARDGLDPKQREELDGWVERLKTNVFAGDQIPKHLIPASLGERNGLSIPLANAWRFELPGGGRCVFHVAAAPGKGPRVIILEILSHKDYDRLFGYG